MDKLKTAENAPIQVQCVYGAQHLRHITRVLLPAVGRTTRRPVIFAALNYDGRSDANLAEGLQYGVVVRHVPNPYPQTIGFAAAHNHIFWRTEPSNCFVILNPDCIPQAGAIDALLARYEATEGKVAIVEGRQWPFAHPKEYDSQTLQTPWASGAFCLIDARFYALIGGMDEVYFLYLEDVDLSWQAWLSGYQVLHEPAAPVVHFSGGPFYRRDLISREGFYSLRNFLLISRKFFGRRGETRARAMLRNQPDQELVARAIAEYEAIELPRIATKYLGRHSPKVKILDFNLFHEVRDN